VLIVKRAKEPAKGLWCFPGGSLELGESLAECAVRELMEEGAVKLRCDPVDSEGFSKGLRRPTAFAAVDSIVMEAGEAAGVGGGGGSGGGAGGGGASSDGRVRFHYVVVEVRFGAAGVFMWYYSSLCCFQDGERKPHYRLCCSLEAASTVHITPNNILSLTHSTDPTNRPTGNRWLRWHPTPPPP